MTRYQVLREDTSINLTNISEQVYFTTAFELNYRLKNNYY